jgi:hypothetical protein
VNGRALGVKAWYVPHPYFSLAFPPLFSLNPKLWFILYNTILSPWNVHLHYRLHTTATPMMTPVKVSWSWILYFSTFFLTITFKIYILNILTEEQIKKRNSIK